MSVGGPLLELSIGGRLFTVAGDADVARSLGGNTKTSESNGNGTARQILTPGPWMLESVPVVIDDMRGDQEFLQAAADSPNDVAITATYLSGAVYQATGSVTGEIKMNSQATTATISLSGGGRLAPQ